MSRINSALLQAIQKRAGIAQARAYQLIAIKSAELVADRKIAALAVAVDLGININKQALASKAERDELASTLGRRAPALARQTIEPSTQQPDKPRRQGAKASKSRVRKSNAVMVVHGRNQRLSSSMFTFLRSIGLQPIEWSQAIRRTKKAAPHVGEILVAAFREAAAVVVLLTPDDEARLKSEFVKPSDARHERELTGQARPNVLFEAGRAFGSHPDSTVLVQIGAVRPFSDTAGVHVVQLSQAVESRKDLADRLEIAGCAVDLTGSAWMTEGDFSLSDPRARTRRRSA